jgi:hypothetical protein
MARPHVADGGDGHQIWRVAASILNKRSRAANKGWSSSLRVGLSTLHSKNKFVTTCYKGPGTWEDSLDKRPKLEKTDMRFSACNVRGLRETGWGGMN